MKYIFLTLFCLYLTTRVCAQSDTTSVFRIDSLPQEGILLDKGWKWHAGDNPDWAKPEFDDSQWEHIDPTKNIFEVPQLDKAIGQIGWFRIRFVLDAALRQQIAMQLNQSGASEIYLNGELIHRFGVINPNLAQIEAFTPKGGVLSFPRSPSPVQVLAVRYALQPHIRYGQHFGTQNPAFSIRLNTVEQGAAVVNQQMLVERSGSLIVGTVGILTILFLAFFLFFPTRKESLYFAIYALGQAISWSIFIRTHLPILAEELFLWNNVFLIIQTLSYLFLLQSVYTTLAHKRGWLFWGLMLLGMVAIWCGIYVYGWGWYVFAIGVTTFVNLDATRVALVGVRKNQKGAWIIVVGGCVYLVCWLFFQLIDLSTYLPIDLRTNFFLVSYLSIPVSFAIFFGYDFGVTNRTLVQKLTEVETLSAEKQQILATQNEVLETQVIERTAELEGKNLELKIEAALDKVRAKSLEMQRSDELKEVVATLYEQLRHLGFQYGAACIFIMDKETNDLVQWVSGFNQSEYPIGYHIKHFNHPVYEAQFTAWKNGDKYVELLLAGEEKKVFDEYMFTQTDFKNFPEQGKSFMQSLQSVVFSLAFLKHGALQWGPEKLNDEQAKILQKFAIVFEHAYTRFLDLQKAESQTRESEIEVALERVRSASLAIHQSHELEKVVVVLFEKLNELGVPFDATFIYFFEKSTRNIEAWVATKLLPAPIKVNMPYDESIANNPIIVDLWNAIENGEHGLNKSYKEKDKDDYYRYEAKHNQSLIPASVTDLQLEAESWTTTFASEKNSIVGIDSWNGHLTTPEDFQILKRFAKVFEQAYLRFLDLKLAEAQAREAQIEVVLERIRSRAMAMNTSEDLNTLIGFIYAECAKLNMLLDRGFIMTFNKATKDAHWWMVSADASDMPLKILVEYHEYAPNLAILNGWEQREQRWSYVLEGNNKKTWDDYQFVNALSKLPDLVKDNMRSVKSVILNASFQNFGCIMLSSFEPLSDDHFDLLMRLSKVFDLTYTRFLDLQLKEQNAIRLIEEKQKLEHTLAELRITQTQLIQKEKLASLGELTAGIAHEIQNPLNFVNNFSEVSTELVGELQEGPFQKLPTSDKEYAEEILGDLSQNLQKITLHGQRASSIVKGMLEHSRTSSGEKQPTDLNALADEYLRLAYHGLRAKDKDFNANLKTDFDPELSQVEVIPQDIGRVLLNLFNNAFYAVQQKQQQTGVSYQPTVSVSTKRVGNSIEIRVQDNGTGIPEAVKQKIFQPFFTTKPTGQGTGLGLSLSYDIVTKGHGGELKVETKEGEGAEFVIQLTP